MKIFERIKRKNAKSEHRNEEVKKSIQKNTNSEVNAELCSNLDDYGQEISAALSQLSEFSDSQAANIEQFSAALQQISSGVQQTSQNTEKSSEFVTSVKNSVEVLVESIEEVAAASGNMTNESQKAQSAAKDGKKVVTNAINAMNNVSTKISDLVDYMTALGQATEEIGKIVYMINGITNQTNMLGLNASIEAARAGEYGKGFAVVAKSIKELSDKSKSATDGISKLIIDIQNRINEAVDKSREGLSELKSGINLVEASGTSIENIIEVVNKTYEYSNSITESTKLQNESSKGIAKYMDELNENISEIASTTMQESSGMQEVTAGIETIKENVDELASGIKEINELSQYIVDNSNKLKSNLEK